MSYYYLLLCINIKEVDGGFMNEIIREIQKKFGIPVTDKLTEIDDEELEFIIYSLNRYITDGQRRVHKMESTISKGPKNKYTNAALSHGYSDIVAVAMFTILIICAKMHFYPDYCFNRMAFNYFRKKRLFYDIEILDGWLSIYDRILKYYEMTTPPTSVSDIEKELDRYELTPDEKKEYLHEFEGLIISKTIPRLTAGEGQDRLNESENVHVNENPMQGNSTSDEVNSEQESKLEMLITLREDLKLQHDDLDDKIKEIFYDMNPGSASDEIIAVDQNSISDEYKKTIGILTEFGEICGEGAPRPIFDKYAEKAWKLMDGVNTTSDLVQRLCELLCESLRYFALVGKDPAELIRISALGYDYTEYMINFSKYKINKAKGGQHK